jgi:hypothetical protein
MFKKMWREFIFAGTLFFLTACGSDEKNARVQIWLTDAPGDYQEVNIDIEGVEAQMMTRRDGPRFR